MNGRNHLSILKLPWRKMPEMLPGQIARIVATTLLIVCVAMSGNMIVSTTGLGIAWAAAPGGQGSSEIFATVKGYMLSGAGTPTWDRMMNRDEFVRRQSDASWITNIGMAGSSTTFRADGDGETAIRDGRQTAFSVGLDRETTNPRDRVRQFGIAVRKTTTSLSFEGKHAEATVDGVGLEAYRTMRWRRHLVRWSAAYTTGFATTQRHVGADAPTSEYTLHGMRLAFEAYRPRGLFPDEGIEPFGEIAYVHATSKAIVEQGAGALRGGNTMHGVVTATVGMRGERAVYMGGLPARFRGGIAWRQLIGQREPTETLRLPGGDEFEVSAAPIFTSALLTSAKATLMLTNNVDLSLGYTGEMAAQASHHTMQLELAVSF